MQPNEDSVTFDLQARRNERHHADRDTFPDTRDRTIAELKSQVTFLRRELSRRDDVLMFLAGMVGPHSEDASSVPDETSFQGPPERAVSQTPARTRGASARRAARGEAEKPKWPPLPAGYRVVATTSNAWVLVARGVRVAGYRGSLHPEGAARDAWEHHERNG
ncbi:MAG: hypothetical protein M3N18_04700 [Actinomycetota bacterium]|nr:hypothetical protein [Actinomycetota bacterium]